MRPHAGSETFAVREALAGRELEILASVISTIDIGVMLTELDHTTVAVNRRFCELFGIDGSSVVNEDVEGVRQSVRARIVHLAVWEQNLAEAYADPFRVQVDRLELKNPDCILLRETRPVLNERSEPSGRIWTFIDHTAAARREARDHLLQRMSTLFDRDPRAVYQGLVREISAYYDSTCVLSIRDNTIMHFYAIASPIPGVEEMTQNVLGESYCQFCLASNGPIIIQDARLDPAHSAILPAREGLTRYMGVPLLGADGDALGTLCILDHRSDELLSADDLQLMQLVAMRLTAELEREARLKNLESNLADVQSQLVQSEKLAATGALAATIAHDVRNIVSAMRLDWEGNAPPRTLDHLDRFSVLCHRLLSYSRPKKLEIAHVQVAVVLRRVLDLFARHCQLAGVEVILDVESEEQTIRAIEDRLESLFANLVLNAIQSMPDGGSLSIKVFGSAPGRLMVTFCDSGPGFPENIETRLKKPFRSGRPGGFGLGLYSCRQIMNEVGGSMTLRNADGAVVELEFVEA